MSVGARLARLNESLLGALSRTTSSGRFIPEVDGLRFIAIAAVVLHHITATYLRETQRLGPVDLPRQWWDVFPRSLTIEVGYAGHFGVPLFFVISGFILALPFVQHYRRGTAKPALGAYYLRRLVRLDPPYLINLTLAFAFIVLTKPEWSQFVPHYLAGLLYLHGPVFGQSNWIAGILWSLEVEVQFYIVMPVLARVFAVPSPELRRTALLAAVLVLAYVAGDIPRTLMPRTSLSLLKYLQFFLAGFLLADLYEARIADGVRRRLRWDLLALIAGGIIYWILTRRYGLYYLTPLLIVLLYIGLYLGRIGHAFITGRWIVITGGMCYSIYLYHLMVIHWLAPYTMSLARPAHAIWGDVLLQCLLLAPAILLSCMLAFVLAERPFMGLSRRLSRKLQARGPGVTMGRSDIVDTPAGQAPRA